MITFIVSTFQRPEMLEGCLATIRIQPEPKRVIVADNSIMAAEIKQNRAACVHFGAEHYRTWADSPYLAANWAVENCNITTSWLCFPSDDGLIVSGFTEIMLHEAERNPRAGLINCDCIYRQEPTSGSWPAYQVLHSEPRMALIDKTNFIVRRELFKGFPPHPDGYCDGALVEQLVRDGVRCAKAPGVLVLHQ